MFTIFSVFYSNFEIAGKYILLTPGRRTPRRNPLEESPHGTLSALEPATEYIFLVHLNIFTNTSPWRQEPWQESCRWHKP